MAKKPRPEGKKYNFMDTYGDMMTLLMCFFVLLFAMSSIDETKYNAFVEALSSRFGPAPANLSTVAPNADSTIDGDDFGEEEPTGDMAINPDETLPADFSEIYKSISDYIEENNLQGEVAIEQGESGAVFIRLSDSILFGGNSSALRAEALPFLDFLGEALLSVESQVFQVQFLGHTASIAGSGTDDWYLSCERSGRVVSYFERTVGFSPYKMRAEGFGRHYPIGDNGTSEGLAANRRVDIIVIGNDPATLMQSLAEASRIYFPSDTTDFFEGVPDELPGTALDAADPLGGADLSHLTPEEIADLQDIVDDYTGTNSE